MTDEDLYIKSITFFGSSKGTDGDPNYDAARKVAKVVAASGRRVVNGGGSGTMLAATLGAKEGGGKTSVVYYKPEFATEFEGKEAFNHADQHFEETNYIMRTKKLLELGDAYIVFNGGTGTLSEFAMAWGLARLYFGHHKPLILYGAFWHHLMDDFKKYMIARREEYQVFTIVTNGDEVMSAIDHYEKILHKNRHEHQKCSNAECHLLL